MHKTVVHIGHEFVISQLKEVSFRLALYLLSYLSVKPESLGLREDIICFLYYKLGR